MVKIKLDKTTFGTNILVHFPLYAIFPVLFMWQGKMGNGLHTRVSVVKYTLPLLCFTYWSLIKSMQSFMINFNAKCTKIL